MIKPDHELNIKRQDERRNIAWGSRLLRASDSVRGRSKLMRRINALHPEHTFAGARMLRDMLQREGFEVGRKHVGTLLAKMPDTPPWAPRA